jgi:DNA-binding MarR family transcriptional regulator
MSDRPTQGVVQAWASLLRKGQSVLARVSEDLKKAGFPPLEWYDVLLELDRAAEGVLPQSTVQSRVLLAQYNLCRLVDRLEREGLVERRRCPHDARSNWLAITPEGRALRRRMWPAYAAAIQTHLGSRLSAEEAHTLTRLLSKLDDDR